MMKATNFLALLIVMLLVFAACGPGGAAPAQPAGQGAAADAPAAGSDAAEGTDAGGEAGGGRHITISSFPRSPASYEFRPTMYEIPMQEAFPNDTFEYVSFADFMSLQIPLAAGAGPDILHLSIGGPTAAIELVYHI